MKASEMSKEFLIKEYVENKKSYKQIADENGIKHDEAVRQRMIKLNIPRRNISTILTKEYLEKHYIELDKGTSQIAEELGVAISHISRKITEYDIRKTIDKRYKNKKFANLTVLGIKCKNKHGQTILKCLCDCGNITETTSGSIATGNTTSCGCKASYNRRGQDNPSWSGYKEISGSYWGSIVAGARSRNINFEITIEKVWNLFLQQNRRCAISGEELHFSINTITQSMQTASLDRIDSSKDYTIDNVQWVHKDINRIKQHYNMEEFINWCHIISNYNKEN